jgi:3',5'-cyclic AMP phosphodiesterase CpdA
MVDSIERREILKLAGLGGVVFASRLAGLSGATSILGAAAAHADPWPAPTGDFYFIQLSDSHWGYEGPANPQAQVTLPTVIDTINNLSLKPDFDVFTGDLTHNTDDPFERRRRMVEFKQVVSKLNVRNLYLMPGEHDAALDFGTVYKSMFGPTHYTFDHKGVHFIVLDNVSDPRGLLGDEQLGWLKQQLSGFDPAARIVVLAHRPLLDLYPDWEWATRDGAAALKLLMPFANVTVFYGHIHQEHHSMTGHIAHFAAKSLIFPLPAPGSKPKPGPIPWDETHPYRGLGYRSVDAEVATAAYRLVEHAVSEGGKVS